MNSRIFLRYGYCFRVRSNPHFMGWTHPSLTSSHYPLPYSTTVSPSADRVLLYKNTHTQTKFFRLIFIMSGVQLVFWGYLSYFAFVELRQETLLRVQTPPSSSADRDTPAHESSQVESTAVGSERVISAPWYCSLRWRLTISVLTLGVGVFFAITASMYPLRVVQRMSYVRGKGGGVAITTFSPTRGTREVLVDLNNIAVAGSRVAEGKGRQLGMKVKGHRMFYLLDREGDFPSPKLFDTLIGARRL